MLTFGQGGLVIIKDEVILGGIGIGDYPSGQSDEDVSRVPECHEAVEDPGAASFIVVEHNTSVPVGAGAFLPYAYPNQGEPIHDMLIREGLATQRRLASGPAEK